MPEDKDTLFTEKVPSPAKEPAKYLPDQKIGLDQEEEQNLMTDLWGEFDRAVMARGIWIERQNRFMKKRSGMYAKKNFPWPGAANYHLPLIDKSIRKFKPTFVSLLADVVPTASFMSLSPQGYSTEPYIEREFHWLFWQRMDAFEEVVVSTDWMLSRGFCVAKVFYEKRTRHTTDHWEVRELPPELLQAVQQAQDQPIRQWLQQVNIPAESLEASVGIVMGALQSGKKDFKLTYEVVEYDAPRLVIKKPEDIVVSSDTTNLDDARFIFEVSMKSGKDLRDYAKQVWYRPHVVEAILEGHGKGNQPSAVIRQEQGNLIATQELRAGMDLWQSAEDLYQIVESYFFQDVDGDGEDERVVFVMAKDYPQEPLATYLYKRRRWPYQMIFFDQIGQGHTDHRGHAELLDPLQTVLKTQHDQKIDRQTISTALSFKYVPGGVHPGSIRYIPGQGIPVRSMNEFEFITPPNVDFSFDKEMMMLKAWAEETVGNPDYGNTNALSETGNSARTAREISAIAQEKQLVLSLDAKVFLHCWQKVFERVWEEWMDYGPREFVIRMMGEPPIEVHRTGMVLGEFQIMPAGNLWNSNPLMNLAKAQHRVQTYLGNPFVRQRELIEDALLRDDPRLAARLLTSPQEAQQMQQQMSQAAYQKGSGSAPKNNGQGLSMAQASHVAT